MHIVPISIATNKYFRNHNYKKNINYDLFTGNLNSSYNISFEKRSRKIYTIDKDGKLEKYKSQKEAGQKLGLSNGSICNLLRGRGQTLSGLAFVFADTIEEKNANGTTNINTDKVNEITQKTKFKEPLYVIDSTGKYKKYNSAKNITSELGIKHQHVSLVVNGRIKTTSGVTIVPASKVETINNNGDSIVDANKILAVVTEKFNKALYAIDKDGNFQKYNSMKEMSKATNISYDSIYSVLKRNGYTAGGYTIVPASSIEIVDENGEITVDKSKIKELVKNNFPESIYAIDMKGNYIKTSTQKEMAEKLDVNSCSISNALSGRTNTIKNRVIIPSSSIEKINEDGTVIVDADKLFEIICKKYERL